MNEHPLDRPVWASLTTRHAHLAHGSGPALRYDLGIIPFVSVGADDKASLEAMAELAPHDQNAFFVQAAQVDLPDGLEVITRAKVVQMLLVGDVKPRDEPDFVQLTPNDAPAMLELATLTKPGPFTLRAGELGAFWGVKQDGALIAMAGQRFHHTDFGEVSGVCTHPSQQGKGLGRRMTEWMTAKVMARGETPFLHTYDTNAGAIHLYEQIGYRIRAKLNVTVLRRRAG